MFSSKMNWTSVDWITESWETLLHLCWYMLWRWSERYTTQWFKHTSMGVVLSPPDRKLSRISKTTGGNQTLTGGTSKLTWKTSGKEGRMRWMQHHNGPHHGTLAMRQGMLCLIGPVYLSTHGINTTHLSLCQLSALHTTLEEFFHTAANCLPHVGILYLKSNLVNIWK